MPLKKSTIPPFFEVHEQVATGYKSLYVLKDLKQNTVLASFHGTLFSEPTRYTVQINANQHMDFINHKTYYYGFYVSDTLEVSDTFAN